MANKIELGTPIKGFKNVKTGEIKTYEEWIDEQEPKEKNKTAAICAVNVMIFREKLIPVV